MVKRLNEDNGLDDMGRRIGAMTVSEFEAVLQGVLGYGWKTRFSVGTGIATSTISRYMSGRYPIPQYIAVLVRLLFASAKRGEPVPRGFEQPADLDTTRWPGHAKLPPAIQRDAPGADAELYDPVDNYEEV